MWCVQEHHAPKHSCVAQRKTNKPCHGKERVPYFRCHIFRLASVTSSPAQSQHDKKRARVRKGLCDSMAAKARFRSFCVCISQTKALSQCVSRRNQALSDKVVPRVPVSLMNHDAGFRAQTPSISVTRVDVIDVRSTSRNSLGRA